MRITPSSSSAKEGETSPAPDAQHETPADLVQGRVTRRRHPASLGTPARQTTHQRRAGSHLICAERLLVADVPTGPLPFQSVISLAPRTALGRQCARNSLSTPRPATPPCRSHGRALRKRATGNVQAPDLESSCLRSTGRCADLRLSRWFPSVSAKLSQHHSARPRTAAMRSATLAWFDVGQRCNALDAVALDEPRVGSPDRVVISIDRSCVGDGGQERRCADSDRQAPAGTGRCSTGRRWTRSCAGRKRESSALWQRAASAPVSPCPAR
jgi:hypothetical protein